jgi:hypothetical protein
MPGDPIGSTPELLPERAGVNDSQWMLKRSATSSAGGEVRFLSREYDKPNRSNLLDLLPCETHRD